MHFVSWLFRLLRMLPPLSTPKHRREKYESSFPAAHQVRRHRQKFHAQYPRFFKRILNYIGNDNRDLPTLKTEYMMPAHSIRVDHELRYHLGLAGQIRPNFVARLIPLYLRPLSVNAVHARSNIDNLVFFLAGFNQNRYSLNVTLRDQSEKLCNSHRSHRHTFVTERKIQRETLPLWIKKHRQWRPRCNRNGFFPRLGHYWRAKVHTLAVRKFARIQFRPLAITESVDIPSSVDGIIIFQSVTRSAHPPPPVASSFSVVPGVAVSLRMFCRASSNAPLNFSQSTPRVAPINRSYTAALYLGCGPRCPGSRILFISSSRVMPRFAASASNSGVYGPPAASEISFLFVMM